jgi:hypothetical protein
MAQPAGSAARHYDTAADRMYYRRTWCQCERPLAEPGGLHGLHCVLCGLHLDRQRAEALGGRCRHCGSKSST